MNRRSILTLSTFACLYGLYAVYAHFVSPLFSPATEEPVVGGKAAHSNESRPRGNREAAEKYLKSSPWAVDASYQVRTDEGTYIFAEEWQQVEPSGEVRLKPFAMIWRRAGDPADKEPITILSDSALVQFASKVEVMNPKPGRMVGGALEGDVKIHGPDGLSVTGKNFIFSENALRIWSDHPVAFSYGRNKGSGHGLEIDLLPETVRLSADKPGVSGLKKVRLRRNVVMDLRSDAKETSSKDGAAPKAVSAPKDKEKDAGQEVHITSAGTFEYVIETHIATFQNEVRVAHPTGPKQRDTLACDLLTLIFEAVAAPATASPPTAAGVAPPPPPVPPLPAAAPARGPLGLAKNLTFRRLRAEGKAVFLVSQRSDLQAEMMELTYDAQSKVITMQDGKQVKVIQKDNEIFCPEITVEHTDDGKVVKAVCRGAGQLKSFAADKAVPARRGPLAFSAEWLRQLQKHADTAPGLDVIEFEGQAKLHQPGQMELEADIVRIWVSQDSEKPPPASKGNDPVPAGPNGSPDKKNGGPAGPPMDVKRLLALQKVAFASPQLIGQTDRLEVWFEDGTLPQVRPAEPEVLESRRGPESSAAVKVVAARPPGPVRSRATPRPADSPSGRTGKGQTFAAVDDPVDGTGNAKAEAPKEPVLFKPDSKSPARPPAKSPVKLPPAPPSPPVTQPKPAPPPMPINVTASLIRVRALQDKTGPQVKTEVAEIWNEGKVHVTQERKPGEAPFELHGERLHVRSYSEANQVIHIVGTPALVKDGTMHLEGPDIHFDRGLNTARVEGAGTLRLPANSSLDGKPLEKPQMLDVWWKEQMRFDGEVAKFFVDVKSVMGESRMKCQEMDVTFSRRISFSAQNPTTDPATDKVKVILVHCKEGVEVENYEYLGNKLIGIQRATAWEFSLSQTTGDTHGQGPGSLVYWRRGNGKRAAMTPTSAVAANRPLQAETVEWEYTRIDFAGVMKGNVAGALNKTDQDRLTTFSDRVRIVYGPVERTTDTVDPDALPKDGGWMRSDMLRVTQHPESKSQLAYFDLLATGNAELEGRTFHALADSVSFDESKKLYLLQSRGQRQATMWRQVKAGSTPSPVVARWMEYSPIGNRLRIDRATNLDGLLD